MDTHSDQSQEMDDEGSDLVVNPKPPPMVAVPNSRKFGSIGKLWPVMGVPCETPSTYRNRKSAPSFFMRTLKPI